MTNNFVSEQQMPVSNQNTAVWDLVLADLKNPLLTTGHSQDMIDLVAGDMRDRDKVGFERYGTRLQAHNGRDCLVDGYQEALDLVVYLRQGIEEGVSGISVIYSNALRLCVSLRNVIESRNKGR